VSARLYPAPAEHRLACTDCAAELDDEYVPAAYLRVDPTLPGWEGRWDGSAFCERHAEREGRMP
jgi:hypothetical protein